MPFEKAIRYPAPPQDGEIIARFTILRPGYLVLYLADEGGQVERADPG